MSRTVISWAALLIIIAPAAHSATNHGDCDKTDSHVHANMSFDEKEGGEDIATALVIAELPFEDVGHTCDNIHDYDEVCPFSGSEAPDVVYAYAPPIDMAVDIDLCNSVYDTKLFVYEDAYTPGSPYACDDDFYPGGDPCGSYVSKLEDLVIYAGHVYYIVIDGWNSDCGEYYMTMSQKSVDAIVAPRIIINFGSQTKKIPYERNHALNSIPGSMTRAVVMVHGTKRNADDYYDLTMDAADDAGDADDHTLIVAPQFLMQIDIDAHPGVADRNDLLVWTNNGWKQGDQCTNGLAESISSFAVMDTILIKIAQKSDNIRDIIVAGHSAGGQFANRYGAGNLVDEWLFENHGVRVRYVVANPSSYLYMNEERWSGSDWYVPTSCSGYNDYKYGLETGSLNPYMSESGPGPIRAQYQFRRVMYLMGEGDTGTGYLDTGCEANLQGANRYQRGLWYMNHLKHYFVEVWGHSICHEYATIPNVGHDASDMFRSDLGLYSLFDYRTVCLQSGSGCTYSMVWGVLCKEDDLTGQFFDDVQSAIDHARTNQMDRACIELMDGTYRGTGNRDINYHGEPYTVQSWSYNPDDCVINCEGSPGVYRRGFMFSSNETGRSLLKGIKVKNGYAVNGGGVFISASSPWFYNCKFSYNDAVDYGGGVYCTGDSPSAFYYCTFFANDADYGGGMYSNFVPASGPDIWFSRFLYNEAYYDGGGWYASNTTGGAFRGLFYKNEAGRNGGAVYLSGAQSNPCICYSLLHTNKAGTNGSGIYATSASTFMFYNSTAFGCSNYDAKGVGMADAGVIGLADGSTVQATNSIIAYADNAAAVHCEPGSEAFMTDCDVYGNEGGDWVDCLLGQLGSGCNMAQDPGFCQLVEGQLTLSLDSPCLPANNACGVQMGSAGEGVCSSSPTPVLPDSSPDADAPVKARMIGAWPNPFNARTTVSFELGTRQPVELGIYTVDGKRVATLVREPLTAGRHDIPWLGQNDRRQPIASGVYFYRLKTSGFEDVGRLVLVK